MSINLTYASFENNNSRFVCHCDRELWFNQATKIHFGSDTFAVEINNEILLFIILKQMRNILRMLMKILLFIKTKI
jgi:hypothetical protein